MWSCSECLSCTGHRALGLGTLGEEIYHSMYFMQKTSFSRKVVSWVWDLTRMWSRVMNISPPFFGCTLHHLRYTLLVLIVAITELNGSVCPVGSGKLSSCLGWTYQKIPLLVGHLDSQYLQECSWVAFLLLGCHPCSLFWHMHPNTDCGICVVIGTGYPGLLTDKFKWPTLSIDIPNT
jgi:hypothetical protein